MRVDDIGVESIGDGSYTLAAHVWVNRRDERAVKYDLNRTVKEEFERRAAKAAPAVVERRAG
jgi:small conductance mechanosensitive channel